jgi:hypothetical protein
MEIYPGTKVFSQSTVTFPEWLREVLSDELPWGEVIFENNELNTETILRIISEAYTAFYSRTSWDKYAVSTFGENYPYILSNVKKWISDRFSLKR